MLACLSLITQAQTVIPSYVPTNSLVGWWPFNGNANDLSINANNGTVNGATLTADRFGNPNKAYSFNGVNNRIDLPLNLGGALVNATKFSFSAFIKPNTNAQYGVFSNWKAFPLTDPFGINVAIQNYTLAGSNNAGTGVTSTTSFTSTWTHIAVVFDGSLTGPTNRMKLYINGASVTATPGNTVYSSEVISNNLGNSATNTSIGAWFSQNGWVGYFNGLIDDIGIWNRVLTPCEISRLYYSSLTTLTVNASSSSSSICIDQSATLTASGASSYNWSNNATTAAITVSPNTTTIYTVTGTTNGCTDTKTVAVTVNAKPTITINSPSICVGQSATLTASGATTYTWNTNSNSASIVVSPSVTTNYTVNGTNTNGCSNTKTLSVTVNAKPIITINSPSICVGQSATLTATGATTYTWNTNSNSASIVVSPSITTNYTVNGTNTNGCSNTKSITVTVNACTGINEAQLPNELSVYPNPTKDNITVVSNPNFIGKTYSITDQLGKLITNGKLTSDNTKISLSSFPNGLYFVKIEGQTFKIVKE